MMQRFLFVAAAVVGLALSGWATFVYPRTCVCSCRSLDLWCHKCGHFAHDCPRNAPKRGPVFGVPSGDCPTCGVNNAVSPSTFDRKSIIEGGR